MSQVVTLFKNVSWVTISQVVTNICAFIWTILIARYLGVTDYGILSFVISFVMILGIGEDMGTTTYSIREISRDKSLTSKFLKNILPLKWVLSLVLLIITMTYLHIFNYDYLIIKVTFIMFLETIFISFCNFLSGVFQAHENLKPSSIGLIITNATLVILTILVIYFDLGLLAIAISYALVYLIYFVYLYHYTIKDFGFPKYEFDLAFWKKTLIKSLPFGLTMIFYSLYFSIDVVMISWLSNDYATGLYNSAFKIISVFTAFYVIYQYVIYPLMSKLYAEDTNLLKVSFEQSFKYSLLILLPISIGVYFYSPYLIELIYSNQYALASPAMQILIWTVVFLFINGVATSLLNSIGKEVSVTKIYLIAAIFNIVLNYITIPIWSYIGASITTVLSEILILILMMHSISKTEYKPDLSLLKTVVKLIICGMILAIVLYFANVSLWLAIPIGLVVYVASLFITRTIDDTDKYIINELLNRK